MCCARALPLGASLCVIPSEKGVVTSEKEGSGTERMNRAMEELLAAQGRAERGSEAGGRDV